MVVGEVAEGVDLLIVGAGTGGYTAALRAAQRGRDVTLVDHRLPDGLGGVCLHDGCIPSKLLIEVADTYAGAARGADMGLDGAFTFDAARFQTYRHATVRQLATGVGSLLDQQRVRLRQGWLRFTRPGAAVLQTNADQAVFLEYRDVIIATGSRPTALPSLPFDHHRVVSSTDVLRWQRLPASTVVIGGGYIGLELGTALAKLGVEVSIVEQADQLLPGMEADLIAPVRRRLQDLGVKVHLAAHIHDMDERSVRISTAEGEQRLPAETVLVSIGRHPHTDQLGLETVGITALSDGRLPVHADRRLARHIAAIGDCTPGPALAHKATAEATVAVEALSEVPVAFDAIIPQVVFSDPPLAVTGLTTAAARAQGIPVRTARFPLSALGRAVANGASNGFAKLIADPGSGVLLGAALVGTHAPELIGELTLAVEMGATAEDLALTVHPHPTFSEQLVEAAHSVRGEPLHALDSVAVRGRD